MDYKKTILFVTICGKVTS